MSSRPQSGPLLTVIAETGSRWAAFGPYVPCLSDDGVASFQATLHDGGGSVLVSQGPGFAEVGEAAGQIGQARSHPARNQRGDLAYFADDVGQGLALIVVRDGRASAIAESCGPLGPTIHESGEVAFRGLTRGGVESVMVAAAGGVRTIAEVGERYARFHGLPVAMGDGRAVFRADVQGGGEAICVGDGGMTRTVVETGPVFSAIGAFPSAGSAGVGFCGVRRNGGPGVFIASAGVIDVVAEARAGFESFRGLLLDGSGPVVFYATPPGGELGIYRAIGHERVLGIGTPMLGSRIVELALNPVSVDARGNFAVRVKLADGREAVLHAAAPR